MAQKDDAKQRFEQGIDAYRAGEYEEALGMLAQARELFVQAGNRTGEAEALGSMGAVYIQMEEWEKAQQSLDEALAAATDAQDRSNQGKVLGNLGMLYARQGDQEKAAAAFEQAIALFREIGERDNEKAVARQMSKLKLKKGKFLEALGDYQSGLEGGAEASGAQKMARKLFRLFGRVTGGPTLEGGEGEEEEDVIDVAPEPDEE
jgi:tetratricopeptide (TPR) repeat protein